MLVGARRGSPLVLGIGKKENLLASDAAAMISHTRDVVYLKDYEIIALDAEEFQITTLQGDGAGYEISQVEYTDKEISKGDYPHYMLKEIYEQPETLANAMRGRLDDADATAHFGGLNLSPQQLRQVDRVIMTACGTSYHAGLVGEYLIEELARMPVEVEYASEFRYRNPPIDRSTVMLAITQSGETADTLAALQEAKERGALAMGVVNVVGSSIARETDAGVYLRVGPEIGVASTKAFTGQVAVLSMLAMYMGRKRFMSADQCRDLMKDMERVPGLIERICEQDARIKKITEKYIHRENWLFLGRGYNYPTALEGALTRRRQAESAVTAR